MICLCNVWDIVHKPDKGQLIARFKQPLSVLPFICINFFYDCICTAITFFFIINNFFLHCYYLQLCEHFVIIEILRKSKQIGHRSSASTFCRWERGKKKSWKSTSTCNNNNNNNIFYLLKVWLAQSICAWTFALLIIHYFRMKISKSWLCSS